MPGIDPVALAKLFDSQRGTIIDMFNMFSGGALERFSLFALGIMPYISASIIVQLLTKVSPKLEQLNKEFDSSIIVSKDVIDSVKIEENKIKSLGEVTVKGFANSLEVYQVE